ncbi:MAG: endonuclease III [Firmicutes bacterium]|nr:endonuclease III [Bacillota bacterium]
MLCQNRKTLMILERLKELYPDARCELEHTNTFELLISTILSAQSTDKMVNRITKKLFIDYKTPSDFLSLSQEELEGHIKEIGLYRNKAKNILLTCNKLLTDYNGEVPGTYDGLISLPGVGRKTANVVLSNGFGVPAIAVDTHVFRVSNRIGIAKSDKVLNVEKQLMKNIPKEMWSLAHHLLIWHGRRTCNARQPKCEHCTVTEFCEFYKKSIIHQSEDTYISKTN